MLGCIRSNEVSPQSSYKVVSLAVSLIAMAAASCGQPSISLSTLNGRDGLRIDGVAGSAAGSDVSSAGDVNGDGIADFIVGAAEASFSSPYAGSTYVLFGKPSAVPVFALSAVNGANGFRIDGINTFDVSGASASGAGDFNGDGLDDIVIGAPGQNADSTYPGAAYIIYGNTAGFTSLNLSALNGSNGMRINGESGDDVLGHSVAGAGDVNGDGFADVILGSDNGFRMVGETVPGKSYVVFGNSSGSANLNLSTLNGSNGFFLKGVNAPDNFGGSVSGAGDINGDGFSDVFVGASFASSNGLRSGSTYVVFGKADWPTSSSVNAATLNGINGFRIDGQPEAVSGRSVSSAGDFNGDGYDDIIIGADNTNGSPVNAGSTYLLFGKADWSTSPVVTLSTPAAFGGIRFDGESQGENSGISVSGAADINGDGFDDIIIGAFTANLDVDDAGSAYVVYGSSLTPPIVPLTALDGSNGFKLRGQSTRDFVGFRVAAAGDVNRDGFGDCIVDATGAEYNGTNSGSAYVIYGGSGPKLTYTGTSLGGNSAKHVLGTGDSRIWLDFDSGSNSVETVHITHSRAELKNLLPVTNLGRTFWNISTNRTGWASCQVTIQYTNAEVAGISGGESALLIYNGSTPSGPWTPLVTTTNTTRNEVSTVATQLGFFVIGGPTTLSTSAQTPWEQYP